MSKSVKVYFYYMTPKRIKAPQSSSPMSKKEFGDFFKSAIEYVLKLHLLDRKYEFALDRTIAWVDYCRKIVDDNKLDLNMIIKSAKYNRIRNVRNTKTMEENVLAKKTKPDGDEERTHICIRDNITKDDYLCIIQSNSYGLRKSKLSTYLNWILKSYADYKKSNFEYEVEFEFVPCDSFIEEIEKMRYISLLKITVDKTSVGDEFQSLADLEQTKETVELIYKRKKRNVSLPKDPIKEYYNALSTNQSSIHRIIAEGTGDNGNIKLDTDLLKLKREVCVETTVETDEVDDRSFFINVQNLLLNMRE